MQNSFVVRPRDGKRELTDLRWGVFARLDVDNPGSNDGGLHD
jgi:hypothetical protein